MGNSDTNNQNKKIIENKNELEFILTRNYISDISIFNDYKKKYESVSYKNININKNGDYIYIICGLIDGFIEIYNHIPNKEFKLCLSFKAHKDLISKIIQLRNCGLLLTGSFDNSIKIFILTCNCTEETLIYTIYLNPIFNGIKDILQLNNNENLILSVFNHIIYFPYNENNLSEIKNNLSDYKYSKYEHRKNFLNNLLQINANLFLALDDCENKILFFKLTPSENETKNIILIKTIVINIYKDNNNDYSKNIICIENLLPKYNFILLSFNNYIEVLDIKYLEIISIHEMKMSFFFFSYDKYIDKIIFFEGNKLFKYALKSNKDGLNLIEDNNKIIESKFINEFIAIKKSIYNSYYINSTYFYIKKYLMKIDINF